MFILTVSFLLCPSLFALSGASFFLLLCVYLSPFASQCLSSSSGLRSLRYLKELEGTVRVAVANDFDPEAAAAAAANAKHNGVSTQRFVGELETPSPTGVPNEVSLFCCLLLLRCPLFAVSFY